ncbi:MAG: UDP-N-acetylmuramoyl-L-alanine--D-glutamate ligase [Gammaproteobacteria bacterium]|nr:UDP-N-acetylmuramoyl-L-alanine--D-glutamate ligase [Gammaproteobacteria bacterium]
MSVKKRLQELNIPQPVAIIGAGLTGMSCYRLLQMADIECQVFDERASVPEAFASDASKVTLGEFISSELFEGHQTILLSPGVDTRRECFTSHEEKILTDIELFAQLTKKPLIGVTGSNGKSTVVSLAHAVTVEAGKNYVLCGNIGLPVLTALQDNEDSCDGYIIELSSYHLERSPSLRLNVGVWLNVSPDHLDRYDSYKQYVETKAAILSRSEYCIASADVQDMSGYISEIPTPTLFSRLQTNTQYFLKENIIFYNVGVAEPVFAMSDFSQIGAHFAENVMAVFAIANYLDVSLEDTVTACKKFEPLACRSVVVGEKNGVLFINDSKGTNVGATAAAIDGINQQIILIAGGQAKGQKFDDLARVGKNKIKAVMLIGEDASTLYASLSQIAPCKIFDDLEQAVSNAISKSEPGDIVLLSPACSSFDMFSSYLERGEVFEKIIRGYISE